LVGTDRNTITDTIESILDNFMGFEKLVNPYGKGDASQKIVDYLLNRKK
jgi:UDP-N-acetylglucosamine 2-epimerase (non-hydrolysing)